MTCPFPHMRGKVRMGVLTGGWQGCSNPRGATGRPSPDCVGCWRDVEADGWCRRTAYLTATYAAGTKGDGPWEERTSQVLQHVGASETGHAVFLGESRAIAVAPPFAIPDDSISDGLNTAPLLQLVSQDLSIGVVMVRLGRYAVGVLRGDTLVASKTGSRYVKSRHRAGGSSQRRFERSRERLIRELFDKTCEVARSVFSTYESGMDYVLLGGERHTLEGFVKRCRYLQGLEQITLKRVLQVERPGQVALDGIASEVWKSQVLVFADQDPA